MFPRLPATDEEVPATRADLYGRVLRWFLTRAHRADDDLGGRNCAPKRWTRCWTFLHPWRSTSPPSPPGVDGSCAPGQLRDAIRRYRPAAERKRPAGDIVQELSIGAGILAPAGNPSAGRHPSYLCFHRTFAEYLVARLIWGCLPAGDWLEVVDQHLWFDPDWAEVIPLLGAQLDQGEARHLTEHLLSQADDPFHHALLTAVRVMGERPDPDSYCPQGRLRAVADAVLPPR